MRITSFTPMKNEGPYVLEWVAYHRMIGFNDIHVFTNHCTDGTDLMLERLDEMGLLRHLPNPSVYTGSAHHHWAMLHYVNTFARLRRSDWVASFDADEFVCVNAGEGRIENLFDAIPEAQVITMNQLNHGCAGHKKFRDALQCETFTMSQAETGIYRRPHNRRGTKSLTRGDAPMETLGNHSPVLREGAAEHVVWTNAGGKRLAPETCAAQVKSLPAEDVSYEHVQLNHFAVRSLEAFLLQKERGNANHAAHEADLAYFRKHDVNQVENGRIARQLPDLREAVAALREDRELDRLHRAAVAHHRARIKDLRAQEDYHALFMKTVRAHKRAWVEVEAATQAA